MKAKYTIQFILWLLGAIILSFNGHANIAIVVAGSILLRSYIIEKNKIETT